MLRTGNALIMEVCPTEIVMAPAERIWELLTDSHELARWSGTKLLDGPPRLTHAGDRIVLGAGLGHVMRVTFEVLDSNIPRQLTLQIRLPFGVVNREHIQITPSSAGACRVTFN
jgi:uncharacterized protein YndB with AHSA1/START domain